MPKNSSPLEEIMIWHKSHTIFGIQGLLIFLQKYEFRWWKPWSKEVIKALKKLHRQQFWLNVCYGVSLKWSFLTIKNFSISIFYLWALFQSSIFGIISVSFFFFRSFYKAKDVGHNSQEKLIQQANASPKPTNIPSKHS